MPTNGESAMKDISGEATYQRLEKDVTAVKNDIARQRRAGCSPGCRRLDRGNPGGRHHGTSARDSCACARGGLFDRRDLAKIALRAIRLIEVLASLAAAPLFTV
jgi:hypothetical protein